jgi:hypothetical protein
MAEKWGLDNAPWRKSSRSDSSNGGCINVAILGSLGAIRDSKNPNGPKIIIPKTALRDFIRQIKQGKFG